MRIAQVAPLFEGVPLRLYGGTERVVYYLTEELVRQGHRVTLFASGDSITSAELVLSVDEAVQAIPGVLSMDRKVVRARFEQRLSATRMAADYLKVYHKMVRRQAVPEVGRSSLAVRSLVANGRGAETMFSSLVGGDELR